MLSFLPQAPAQDSPQAPPSSEVPDGTIVVYDPAKAPPSSEVLDGTMVVYDPAKVLTQDPLQDPLQAPSRAQFEPLSLDSETIKAQEDYFKKIYFANPDSDQTTWDLIKNRLGQRVDPRRPTPLEASAIQAFNAIAKAIKAEIKNAAKAAEKTVKAAQDAKKAERVRQLREELATLENKKPRKSTPKKSTPKKPDIDMNDFVVDWGEGVGTNLN